MKKFKVLQATNKEYKTNDYSITELFSLVDRTDEQYENYYIKVKQDIDKNGMKHPILLTSKQYYWGSKKWKDDNKLGVIAGSNRLRYAIENNYTGIQGVFVKQLKEYKKILDDTYIRVK